MTKTGEFLDEFEMRAAWGEAWRAIEDDSLAIALDWADTLDLSGYHWEAEAIRIECAR